MKIRVTGYSNAVAEDGQIMSVFSDHNVLVDVGTWAGDLSPIEMRKINHGLRTYLAPQPHPPLN